MTASTSISRSATTAAIAGPGSPWASLSMASYTHRTLSTPQAIKSTIPNVARKAPLALD